MWSYTHPAMHLLAALQRRKLGISGAVTMGEGGNAEKNISFQAWTTQIELISFFIFFLNVSFSFFFFFEQTGSNRNVSQCFSLVYFTGLYYTL